MRSVNKIFANKRWHLFSPFCLAALLTFVFFLAYLRSPLYDIENIENYPEQKKIMDGHFIAPEEILRFHVRAHNNSPQEQQLKNYLAQEILFLYAPRWSSCRSKEELFERLSEDQNDLTFWAKKILADKGSPHDVKISLETSFFPARFYEGRLYPPGEYAGLCITIGEGGGENWWCVLFPPLCFNIIPSPKESESKIPKVNKIQNMEEKDEKRENLERKNSGEGSDKTVIDASGSSRYAYRLWLPEFLNKIFRRFR